MCASERLQKVPITELFFADYQESLNIPDDKNEGLFQQQQQMSNTRKNLNMNGADKYMKINSMSNQYNACKNKSLDQIINFSGM